MTQTLFPDLVPTIPTPAEPLSADRRRALRQRADIANGRHPLTRTRFHAEPERRCGNCAFRALIRYHARTYPKCVWFPTSTDAAEVGSPYFTPDRVSHSAASDVRAWWPGCTEHEWGDPKLGPDAARSGPQAVGA